MECEMTDLVPALQHDVVESGRTALGLLHPEAVLHLVQDLQQQGGSQETELEKYPRLTSALVIPG